MFVFDLKMHEDVLAFDRHGYLPEGTLQRVTTNGEISYDVDSQIFVVYDETYAYEVGRTSYPLVALHMLQAYCKHYLGEDNGR